MRMIEIRPKIQGMIKEFAWHILPIVIILSIFDLKRKEEIDVVFIIWLFIIVFGTFLIWEKVAYYKIKNVKCSDSQLVVENREGKVYTYDWKNLVAAHFRYKRWLWKLDFSNEAVLLPRTFSKNDINKLNKFIIENVSKLDAELKLRD